MGRLHFRSIRPIPKARFVMIDSAFTWAFVLEGVNDTIHDAFLYVNGKENVPVGALYAHPTMPEFSLPMADSQPRYWLGHERMSDPVGPKEEN